MTRLGLSIRSLRAKLLLFSLLLVVIPGAIFAFIAFEGARRALEHAVGRQLAELADDAATAIGEAFATSMKDVRAWTHDELMRGVASGDASKQISSFLTSLKRSDGKYLDLLCADGTGRTVAASSPGLLGSANADSPWYRAAMAGKEVIVGPALSPVHERPAVQIAAPIYDPDRPGEIIGALLGLYDWTRAPDLTQAVQHNVAALGMTVDLLILDEHGVVIGAPSEGRLAELAGHNLRADDWLAAQRRLPRPRRGHLIETQADVLVGYARLEGKQPHWTVLAVEARREALTPLYRMQQRLAFLLGGVLLLGLGVATMLAERMSRPLRELTQATQEIARVGETRQPVPVRSQDEIGQLAESFNRMASELKRAQDDLLVAAKFAFVGEVAAGVAHEVRTPLGIMRSSAQLVGRSLPADRAESRELVDTIIDEVDRLDRVVAGLLELARPHEHLFEATLLKPVLERALDFIDAQAREKSVAVRRFFSPNMRPARCDPDQIYQVALNLLVNALQILPAGGEIMVRALPTANGRVAFEVSDNGPGISAEVRERIFTPFFTMREGGTGLGLALVQRVVQEHKGTVSVDSVVGRGTTFRVELPVAEGPQ